MEHPPYYNQQPLVNNHSCSRYVSDGDYDGYDGGYDSKNIQKPASRLIWSMFNPKPGSWESLVSIHVGHLPKTNQTFSTEWLEIPVISRNYGQSAWLVIGCKS